MWASSFAPFGGLAGTPAFGSSSTFWCARIAHPRASPPQGPSFCLRASSDLLHVRHLVGLRIIRPQSSSPHDSSVPIVRLISFNAPNADLTDDLTDLATDLDRDHVTASISFRLPSGPGFWGRRRSARKPLALLAPPGLGSYLRAPLGLSPAWSPPSGPLLTGPVWGGSGTPPAPPPKRPSKGITSGLPLCPWPCRVRRRWRA